MSDRRWPTMLARLGEGRTAGTHDRPQVSGYADPVLEHPWSIVVGHDGVFKVALLTLFDLPLDRFWMWSMDLCAITVIEFRAGRPVLRAHNLTAHLAALDRRGGAWPSSRNGAGAAPVPSGGGVYSRRKANRSRPTRSRRCAAFRLSSRSLAEDLAGIDRLDLGPGDGLEFGSDGRQDITEDTRVFVDRLRRARSEAEP